VNGNLKVSFILLAHESPDELRQLIVSVLESGSDLYVHYDAKSKHCLSRASKSWALEKYDGKLFFSKRERIHWGEWSIVRATLGCLYLWREVNDQSDYLMLISGSCLPIKPLSLLKKRLAENPLDYIEAVSATRSEWVSHGSQEDRWLHYNYINWRSSPRVFKIVHKVQEKLGLKRQLPLGHRPFIGSQWWCLRSDTVRRILSLVDDQPQLERFYRYTWVPDEIFFQSLVANTVADSKLSQARLTLTSFNSRGAAEYQYDDSFNQLMASDSFFARKISPHALKLKESLGPIFSMSEREFSEYRVDRCQALSSVCDSEVSLLRTAANNAWHAFVSSQNTSVAYCASIPNRLVVICGGTWDSRTELSGRLSKIEGVSSYGHLFHQDYIEFGGETSFVAGYNHDHNSLAQHRWPFFMGDICKENSGKTVAFCLGDNADVYLKVLTQKCGLAVLLLQAEGTTTHSSSDELTEVRKQFESRIRIEDALQDRSCILYRLNNYPSDEFLVSMISDLGY